MTPRYILTDYLRSALAGSAVDKLEDGSYAGRIPACTGVVAFGGTRAECEQELRSTLEKWLVPGLKLGHHVPVLGDIDLNRVAGRERVEA